MAIEIGNIYETSFKRIPEEIFEKIVSTDNLKIERIVSKGHASPENFWYDQQRNEWVMLLKGSAVLLFENESEPVRLKPGDYLEIPSRRRHRVQWTDPDEETIWIAVHY